MKRLRILASLAVVSALLSACAQIPHSSSVKAGPDMNGGLAADFLYYSPSGPAQGATAAEVVNGFINAGTGPQNDYAVARTFLSKSLSSTWNPSNQTLVQTGRPLLTQDAAHSLFKISANIVTSINSRGELKQLKETKTLSFHLAKEAGEWRIDQAPDLTLLIKPVFDVIFQSYSIYFLDKPQQHLVPDVRWFPSRASTGTKMVAALLDGPTAWLAPAVSSAIPAATKLNTSSVTIDGGLATVDLTAKALKTNYSQKNLMRSQIYQTLIQLPTVINVRIEIDRSPQLIGTADGELVTQPSSSSFALINKNLYSFNNYKFSLIAGYHGYLTESRATDFALNESQTEFVVVGRDGLSVAFPHTRGAALKLLDVRPNLVTPIIDSGQLVWSMQSDSGHGIRVFDNYKNVASFSPNWMHGLSNKHFAVSPDDARLLVSGYQNGKSLLYAVPIIRDAKGIPKLGIPKLITTRSSLAIDINWVSQSDIVISNYSSTGTQIPEQLTIGGEGTAFPAFDASVSLAASSNGSQVFLLTKGSELYQNRNLGWVLVRRNISAFHFAH